MTPPPRPPKQRAKTRIDAHESRFFGASRAFSSAGGVASVAGDDGATRGPAPNLRKFDYDRYFAIL
jgi:hypothetical protein